MDSDKKFGLYLCGMATALFVSLIGSCTLGAHDRRDKWEKAVSNGADPMVTRCALYGADSNAETAICTILAQGRK